MAGMWIFWKMEKMRKKCEKNILKLRVDFDSFLYILWINKISAS